MVKKYGKIVFPHYNSIPEMFLDTVRRKKGAIAFRFFRGDEIIDYTYADYKEHVFKIAAALIRLGISPGEHISILAHTSHRWCMADMSILCAGAHSVTIFKTLDYEQVKFEIDDSDSVAIFVDAKKNLKKVLKIWNDLEKLRFVVVLDERDPETDEDLTKPAAIESVEGYESCVKKDKIYHFNELLDMGKKVLEDDPDVVEGRIKNIKEDDLATIIYTSGTTGIPKGVMLSHKNLISDAMAGFAAVGIRDNERTTTYLPLAHSFAHTVEYIGSLIHGNTMCFAKNYNSLVDNIHDFKPTAMIAVPYVFEQIHKRVMETVEQLPPFQRKLFNNGLKYGLKLCDLYQRGIRLSPIQKFVHGLYKAIVFDSLRKKLGGELRLFVSGGAPLNPELARFFWAAGVNIYEGYGLTEAAPITHVNRPPETTDVYPSNKIGTVGPVIGWDKWGSELPYEPIEAGLSDEKELLIHGPNVMLGYYKRPEETAEAFIEIDGKKWLKTGDLAEIDEDGYCKIIGRAKQIIVLRTGKKVAPALVEAVYKESKYVDQVMLVGEGQKFIGALVVPNFELKDEILEKCGISDKKMSNEEFCRHPSVKEFFKNELNKTEEGRLSHFEKIKEFRLVPEPWTEENKMLTPSLKLKRKVIGERYFALINEIYES